MKKFKTGAYRATLVEANTAISPKGSKVMHLLFVLESQQTGRRCLFKKIIAEEDRILRGTDFLYFLEKNQIEFKNCEELVGLVFDTEIKYETCHNVSYPVFIGKTLIVNPYEQ